MSLGLVKLELRNLLFRIHCLLEIRFLLERTPAQLHQCFLHSLKAHRSLLEITHSPFLRPPQSLQRTQLLSQQIWVLVVVLNQRILIMGIPFPQQQALLSLLQVQGLELFRHLLLPSAPFQRKTRLILHPSLWRLVLLRLALVLDSKAFHKTQLFRDHQIQQRLDSHQ